jgi:hypothetical protein
MASNQNNGGRGSPFASASAAFAFHSANRASARASMWA